MNPPPRTLVVVPTFNERATIEPLIAQLLALPLAADVLVVDDASPDQTAHAVRAAAARYPQRLHLLERNAKGGRGSAVLAGFTWGLERDYSVLCEMDADLSHAPADLPALLAVLSNADVVIGSRYARGAATVGRSLLRRLFSRIANAYLQRALQLPIRDYTSGYRVYSRRALEQLDTQQIDTHGYIVLSAIAHQLQRQGMRFAEVPIVFHERRQGFSNFSLSEVREALACVKRLK